MSVKDTCKTAVTNGKIVNAIFDITLESGKKMSITVDRGIDADDYTCSRVPEVTVSVRRFIRGEEAANLCRAGRSVGRK